MSMPGVVTQRGAAPLILIEKLNIVHLRFRYFTNLVANGIDRKITSRTHFITDALTDPRRPVAYGCTHLSTRSGSHNILQMFLFKILFPLVTGIDRT